MKNKFEQLVQANDARKDLYDKEKELQDVKQEVLGLKQALKDANDQCVLLFNEVQKAWKVSYTLQSDLKGNAMVTNMVMVTVKAMIMITGIVEMRKESGPKQKKQWNINVQGAYLHVLGDSIQSVGVMIGGAIIWYKPEWKIIDLICTLIFSVIVLGTTIRMLRNILEVLMESTPREIDATRLAQGLCEIDDVTAVHELHIWAITVGKVLLACHVKIKHEANADRVLNKVVDFIRREYNISHVTIQIERE
ncbi:metal tolerance protein A2-like [Eucalyptus grandis]|uniref:metal tolerance protein A2-like n=1 Tax=Eucalyptus grandis TaxID=71139 RepID=UPI00192E7B7D|nr:metal tolerance protein A2-like [Eucalyptus grandis]